EIARFEEIDHNMRIMAGSKGRTVQNETAALGPKVFGSIEQVRHDRYNESLKLPAMNGLAALQQCASCHFTSITCPHTEKHLEREIIQGRSVIFAWELANEPQIVWRKIVRTWIEESARVIKDLDANHLVTTGAEGKNEKDWKCASAAIL
ncbi:5434_t:CDS:2, partial [Paraglomus brasilianum]